MDVSTVAGLVLQVSTMESSEEMRREVRQAAGKAKVWVSWHADRMETDPEYRAAVQHLAKMIANQPGRVGEMARRVLDGHGTLGSVL